MAQNTPAYLERQSTNPMLTAAAFKQERGPITTVGNTGEGVSDAWAATGALALIFFVTFGAGWWLGQFGAWWIAGAIVGLVIAIYTMFRPRKAPKTAPAYAIAEGIFVGGISRFYETAYDGIVLQAGLLTAAIFATMWFLYASGRIRVTPKLQKAIVAATLGVMITYGITFMLSLFGGGVPYIHDSGPIGIGFSLVIIGIAAMNLLIDFDYIDKLNSAPHEKWQDWFAAMGLLITVIWIYLEILRLLSKVRR
jgi:uncharacterized YccA/Bax inhibitor family protein